MLVSIEQRLAQQKSRGLWRELTSKKRLSATTWLIDDKPMVNFSANDYLSLGFDKHIREQYQRDITYHGLGSGGSAVVCGFDEEKLTLAKSFASHLNAERALFVSSGYMANLCVIHALAHQDIEIFLDKYAHASFYDALSMTKCSFKRFHHNDMAHLELLLKQSHAPSKLIITEGVFSMTGQKPDLDKLIALKKLYQAHLLVDDAHALGVIGQEGKGSISGYSFDEIDIVVSSLNKAFCGSGAMIIASNAIIEAVIQFARPYLYSSALSEAQVRLFNLILPKIIKADERRRRLEENIACFLEYSSSLGYRYYSSNSAIHLFSLGCDKRAISLYEHLKLKGYYCYPMRTPTVTKKMTGLRIVINSAHSNDDIQGLCRAIASWKE